MGKSHEVYDYLDYIHFDIKHLNSEKHKEWTGQGNEVILDTFRKMREAHPNTPCVARTPIIPGFNDTEEDIIAIRDFVKQFPNTTYEVLRYIVTVLRNMNLSAVTTLWEQKI